MPPLRGQAIAEGAGTPISIGLAGVLLLVIQALDLSVLAVAWLSGQPRASMIAFLYLGFLTLLVPPTFYVLRERIAGPFRPDRRHWRPMLAYGVRRC